MVISTLYCAFEVAFCQLRVLLQGGCLYHIVVGPLVGCDLHHLHLLDHFGDVFELVLVSQQVDQEIEVFQVVLPLVEEGLKVCVDAFVDIPMVVFLYKAAGTS